MEALITNIWLCIAVCALTWVLSIITREHSWVDRIWSIIPVVYLWVFAAGGDFTDWRLNIMAILGTLWGARLTFNFARKGGYARGGEDYRWPILRARMPRWMYEIFNIVFIVIYQNVLLLLITLPAFTILIAGPTPLNAVDVFLTFIFLGLLVLETVADQQQWNFHQQKRAQIAAGKRPHAEFLSTGLFAYSRHPNFFAEQAQWWVIFLFAATAAGSLFEWTIIGPILLTLLFIGSTRFTEAITVSKYPAYADYQKRVSMLIPWWPRKRSDILQTA